jgi:hypothetical protein
MNLYRYLTGPDDASFCHRISEALNRGWQLYGSPSLTYDPEKKQLVCGQAIIKEVDGARYSPELDLGKL